MALVLPTAPDISRVDKSGAAGIGLGHKGIVGTAAVRSLECSRSCRKIDRRGQTDHIGIARGVHTDAEALVLSAAAEIGGVYESGARGIQFRQEGVLCAAGVRSLKRARSRWKVDRIGQ